MGAHKDSTSVHIPYAYSYADATARLAATGFMPADVGKFARQESNNSIWMLTDDSPITWVQVGGAAYTTEEAQDAIGAMIADTNTIDLTYTDATPELKADARTQMSITSDSSGLKLSGDSATPGNNKVYGTDGSGNKGWKADPSGGASASDAYILIRDEKTSGTDGGTATSGSYQTRTLNTEVVDTANLVTLASNQMTLLAGTYRVRIVCPAFHVSAHKARLYNITDSAVLLLGTSHYINTAANYADNDSVIVGRFTIAGTKVLEVQHRVTTTQATNGFGNGCGFGDTEVYTVVEMWKEQ